MACGKKGLFVRRESKLYYYGGERRRSVVVEVEG